MIKESVSARKCIPLPISRRKECKHASAMLSSTQANAQRLITIASTAHPSKYLTTQRTNQAPVHLALAAPATSSLIPTTTKRSSSTVLKTLLTSSIKKSYITKEDSHQKSAATTTEATQTSLTQKATLSASQMNLNLTLTLPLKMTVIQLVVRSAIFVPLIAMMNQSTQILSMSPVSMLQPNLTFQKEMMTLPNHGKSNTAKELISVRTHCLTSKLASLRNQTFQSLLSLKFQTRLRP